MWIIMAVLSAFFAGLTAILAKCGIKKTDSDVATALRTVVVLLFSWIMVFLVGSAGTIGQISGKSLIFLILSGLATGASWICYFKALSRGDINKVVPIDKSSTILSVLMAIFLLGETEHLAVRLAGTVLLAVGVFLMIERKKTNREKTNREKTDEEKTNREKTNEGKTNGEKTDEEKTAEEKTNGEKTDEEKMDQEKADGAKAGAIWMPYAVASAVFAALTSILAKIGISGVESNLGTAIRTGVVLAVAWLIVFVKGKQRQIREIDRRELVYISLSGLATGASWLCYYYAIQNGVVSVVVPIDKLSIVVTIAFSWLVFHERLSKKAGLGLVLIVAGTFVMLIP